MLSQLREPEGRLVRHLVRVGWDRKRLIEPSLKIAMRK